MGYPYSVCIQQRKAKYMIYLHTLDHSRRILGHQCPVISLHNLQKNISKILLHDIRLNYSLKSDESDICGQIDSQLEKQIAKKIVPDPICLINPGGSVSPNRSISPVTYTYGCTADQLYHDGLRVPDFCSTEFSVSSNLFPSPLYSFSQNSTRVLCTNFGHPALTSSFT